VARLLRGLSDYITQSENIENLYEEPQGSRRSSAGAFRRHRAFRGQRGANGRLVSHALQVFGLYTTFSMLAGTIVGVPIVLSLPPGLFSRLTWPLVLLAGAMLGPIALFLIFIVLFAAQGRITEFSLARTGTLWPLATLVSTVSVVVYAALVRRFLVGRL
jgi:hypothetical protein